MKKLFLVAALGVAGLMSASNNVETFEETIIRQNAEKEQYGCYGELWIYDDYSESYLLVNHFEICCYDTAEEACGVVNEHLDQVASNYP
ncbi:hypothetical protein [Chryseobacterium sp.]|uniref:hypothetical protein n=1 Tax=Chryseobacterium sp. TaxID=1871047 RepID=UPI0028A00B02|nr:hypothetical protein [Chryseobacterium sp.]